MRASYHKYILNFKHPSGTSRGFLRTKETWYLIISSQSKIGIGECGLLRGLSMDDRPDYELQLSKTCKHIDKGLLFLYDFNKKFPSIQMGLEMAFKSLESETPFSLFPSEFIKNNKPIPINGLIWMGSKNFMKQQIKEKIDAGFNCIKIKIGAIDFEVELELLKSIRHNFSDRDIELRVDANGAFIPNEALEKIKRLSDYNLHSIEQPIQPKQYEKMAELCQKTPLPIALDEDLIGLFTLSGKQELLKIVKPQYIILKPSFIGGFKGSDQWISVAKNLNIGWWITSALESNVGLSAIAQYTYLKKNTMPQGLGTGRLFSNNFDSPLRIKNGKLHYNTNYHWKFNL